MTDKSRILIYAILVAIALAWLILMIWTATRVYARPSYLGPIIPKCINYDSRCGDDLRRMIRDYGMDRFCKTVIIVDSTRMNDYCAERYVEGDLIWELAQLPGWNGKDAWRGERNLAY